MEDEAQVSAGAGSPEIQVAGLVDAVELEAGCS
jgi:hypothetical protein